MSSPNAPITGVVRLRGTHARASSSSNTLSHRPHLRPSARHHVYEAESPNREEHDVDPSEGPFPFKAYEMLEDKALTTYVQWHQERGSHGLLIPNIGAFVEYALPKHFPGVKKWGSFQKQLSNYGFEKQDRSTTQAFYTHWNNKFRQGHPELLPEVTRRPDRGVKTSTRQDAVQKQPATTPDSGSQPLNLLELQEWINRLENDFNEIKNENIQIRNENNQLKRENNHLKNEVLELKYRQSASEGRLDKVETQLQDVMRELSARSVGGGLLNSGIIVVFWTVLCSSHRLVPTMVEIHRPSLSIQEPVYPTIRLIQLCSDNHPIVSHPVSTWRPTLESFYRILPDIQHRGDTYHSHF